MIEGGGPNAAVVVEAERNEEIGWAKRCWARVMGGVDLGGHPRSTYTSDGGAKFAHVRTTKRVLGLRVGHLGRTTGAEPSIQVFRHNKPKSTGEKGRTPRQRETATSTNHDIRVRGEQDDQAKKMSPLQVERRDAMIKGQKMDKVGEQCLATP